MALPKSFADDGASGSGSAPGGIQMTDAQSLGPGAYANGALQGFGGVTASDPRAAPTAADMASLGPGAYANGHDGAQGGTSVSYTGGGNASPLGLSFSGGGAIDDGTGDDTDGTPQQDAIQKALSTIDGVLAFGRKLHGLGGGNDEGNSGAIQTADAGNGAGGYQNGRMPAVPGSQSNSGVPPIRPEPGPLPPTSNPFGKRADAGQDQTQDQDQDGDNAGAINTEEDTA